MGDDTEKQSVPTTETKSASVESIEQRLSQVEKTEARMFEVLKWGFGTLMTLAIIFSGFNWLSNKTNYERDKDSLKAQIEALQKQQSLAQREITDSNNKQIDAIKLKIESAMDTALNDIHRNFSVILQTNQFVWSNIVGMLNEGTSNMTHNYFKDREVLIQSVNQTLSTNKQAILSMFKNTQTNVNAVILQLKEQEATSAAYNYGIVLWTDAKQRIRYSNGLEDYKIATTSYMNAILSLLNGHDISNLNNCAFDFCENCIPAICKYIPKKKFQEWEIDAGIEDNMTSLIQSISTANTNDNYTVTIKRLNNALSQLRDKLSK